MNGYPFEVQNLRLPFNRFEVRLKGVDRVIQSIYYFFNQQSSKIHINQMAQKPYKRECHRCCYPVVQVWVFVSDNRVKRWDVTSFCMQLENIESRSKTTVFLQLFCNHSHLARTLNFEFITCDLWGGLTNDNDSFRDLKIETHSIETHSIRADFGSFLTLDGSGTIGSKLDQPVI